MSESAWGSGKAGTNPWEINYFSPPTPHVDAPKPRASRPIPEQHDLFTVQRHALDALHDIAELEARLGDHAKDRHVAAALKTLERDCENTYRVIRTWLKANVNQGEDQ